ncbi:MAG: endonuclease [Bacteroidota bacterium]|mgnify:CR=1 FL=1|jgi:endonuclease-3
MKKQVRYQGVIDYFIANVPIAETELTYDNPFQLLVAVILSAQCTDKRVNLTTPGIFKKFPDPASMSKASFDDLFPLVRSISYPNNKTKHLIGMSQLLMDTFNGAVPMTIEDLIKLPGVGRKTANVITSVIDQQPNMAVDTHVFRVSRRVGLVPMTAKTPLAVEKDLIKNIPADLVHKAHHWLILHGRYTCLARSPKCDSCGITAFCKYFEKETKKKVSK